MFCSKCGNKLDDDAKFCPKCGQPVENHEVKHEEVTFTSNNFVPVTDAPKKSKIAAALLAFFLGVFGIHNFYLGYQNKGIAQLLMTILSIGLLAIVTAIWSFIEFILILTDQIKDSDGRDLE